VNTLDALAAMPISWLLAGVAVFLLWAIEFVHTATPKRVVPAPRHASWLRPTPTPHVHDAHVVLGRSHICSCGEVW
jgi:hypothetical protein